MIQFLINHLNENSLPFEKEELKIIDLGTGNGHLLFQMHEDMDEDCEVNDQISLKYTGIDYSPDSVKFASDIAITKYEQASFEFDQVDLLQKESEFLAKHEGEYDILLDKGTLDAIGLNNEPLEEHDGKIGMEIYSRQISKIMHKDSILLITSCNFTESELIKVITENGTNNLEVWDQIQYPSFQFGGIKGSTICSIAFIKK